MKKQITSRMSQIVGVTAVAMLMCVAGASGQPAATNATKAAGTAKSQVRPSGNPARDNLLRLQTIISIDESSTRMSNVIEFIQKETGATFEPFWKGDRSEGLEKDQELPASYKDLPAITVLEKVLSKYSVETGTAVTWQISDVGAIQIGPKSYFNKNTRRIQIYDINDLLFVMPSYDQAPEIDLEKVLQAGGKGGGGAQGSPFRQNQQNNREKPTTKEERARDLISLLTQLVESDQLGDIPEPKYYQGNIIVDAPDYYHRAIAGYPYWPSTSRPGTAGGAGRRYVSLTTDNQLASVKEFVNTPITGAVGGGGTGAGGGGGGGGEPRR